LAAVTDGSHRPASVGSLMLQSGQDFRRCLLLRS
jgi:hypothetical protein